MLGLLSSQVLNGLAIGQVYALIALGFSLVFGVANVMNFAQGAMFMLGALLTIWAGSSLGLPLLPACALAIALVTVLSVGLERITIRPLANRGAVAPLLATLAVSVVLEQAAEWWWGPDSLPFPNPVSRISFLVGDAFISGADILLTCVGVAALIGLTWFVKASWLGRALRMTSQDPDAAAQMGIRVVSVRRVAFALSGALGAISGILVGFYFQSAFPQMGLPFGLKGFAAAILGGLSSLPGAVVGGLTLGVLETLTSAYLGEQYRDLVAYTLLLVIVMFRPAGLFGDRRLDAQGGVAGAAAAMPSSSLMASGGGQPTQDRALQLPGAGYVLVIAVLALLPWLTARGYILHAASSALILALGAISVTLLSGTAGVLALGQAAYIGVGAYTAAILAHSTGAPAEVVLIGAAVLGASAAALSSVALLRLSGHTVGLGTLAIGQIGTLIFLNWLSVTRGPMGIPDIPQPSSLLAGGGVLATPAAKYLGILFVSAVTAWAAHRIANAPLGRKWRAIREDRLAAQASGLATGRYIVLAFAVGGAVAGVAGGLFAYLNNLVSPESFGIDTSISVLTMAVVGGLGNVTGAALVGLALAIVPELLRGYDEFRLIAYGLVLLMVLRVRPRGLLGAR